METGEDSGSPMGLSSRQIWLVVGGLMVGTFLSALDVLVVITSLPTIVGNLGGRERLSWVITAYLLTSTASGPLLGKLGDLYGRKRLYQIAIGVFVLGSVVSGFSQNINQLIFARGLQGVGAGGLMVLPMAIIGDIASPRQRARYQGVMTANIALASVLGPLVGGFFVDHASWRWIFFVNVPLGGLALAAAAGLKLPVRRAARVTLDIAGSLLLVAASVCAVLALTLGRDRGWTSPPIVAMVLGAAVLAALFVGQERRAAEPVLPPRLFANRTFAILVAGSFLLGMSMYGGWVLTPIFLQVVTGATATNSGLLLLPFIMSLTVASIVSGRLVSRWGRFKVFPVVGQAFATLGFFLYATMGAHTTRTTASLYMMATGFGLGLTLQIVVVIAQGTVEHRDLGAATAAVGYFRSLGSSFGTAMALGVYNARFAQNLRALVPAGARAALSRQALQGEPSAIRQLPPGLHHSLVEAFARSLHSAFVWIVPPAALAFVVILFVREIHPADRSIRST